MSDSISLNDFQKICENTGISMADGTSMVGRKLHFGTATLRTVVVTITDSDTFGHLRDVFSLVVRIDKGGYVVNRFGGFEGIVITETECMEELDKLISRWPTISRESDDMYIVSKTAAIIVLFDHHMLMDGLPIFVASIDKASQLIAGLNDLGAEFQVYSKRK
ncbi:MAG: hypothetical protein K8I00_00455 [Candidatus Omnitrophica bacterium]|nr:hypothetical protein [Candidatus Omnitrophota bacterium]